MTCLGILECMDLSFSLSVCFVNPLVVLVSKQCFIDMTQACDRQCSLITLFNYLNHCFGGQFLVGRKP